MSQKPFSTRKMESTESDLSRFKDCFDTNGSGKQMHHLRWQYIDRPGDLFVDVAVADDDGDEMFAGVYSVFPTRFLVHGREVLATQSLDTMTDHRFRKRGVFKTLAGSLYERLESEGVAHVYGFPNGSSIHGFRKHLGWQVLDPVPFMIRPLRTGHIAKMFGLKQGSDLLDFPLPVSLGVRTGTTDIRDVRAFGDDFDGLWAAASAMIQVGIVRDQAYLAWRFDRNPSYSYQTRAAYNGNTLLGFVTFRVADKHSGRIGYIMEVLEKPGANVMTALLARALRDMRAQRADAVLAWNLAHSFNHAAHQRVGFMALPERLRPIELHFGVRPFGDFKVADRQHWYLSYCDSDTV